MADDSRTAEKRPLVSVCMPCYNAEKTVEEAVNSALRQDVDLEILITDDQSTDGTAKVLARLAKDRRVRIIRAGHKLGAAGGRNLAVQNARGRYIAYLDADDLWREGKLSRQVALLEKSGAAICCTGRELMTPEGQLTGRMIGVKKKITYRDLLRTNSINCSSVLLRRETALAHPMEHEDSHEDYITWLKILGEGKWAAGIDEPLLIYRLSNAGKSGNKLKSAGMTFRAYRYAGISTVGSVGCFMAYAISGVWKYLSSRWRKK